MTTFDSGRQPGAELLTWLSALRALSAASTSAADLKDVLDLVADTARTLLGFDFCGVLTPDPNGESLMITGWSGLSATYVEHVNTDRPVRLDGGSPSKQAFRSGRPVTIRDIDAEPEFTPWGGVAREQGYRAIVCVPLIAGTEVLGTLNGYYTPVHTFTAYEIERLALLANHAAIALTSARRLDELRRLNVSLREQRDALTRSEQIHERLLAVTLRSGGLSGIAAVLAELIGRPVLIDDSRNDVLATAGDDTELPDAAWRTAAVIDPPPSSAPIPVHNGGEDGAQFSVSIAKLGDDAAAARIWFPARGSELDPMSVRAVEHASIVISLELLRMRTAAEVEHRLRGELLADLLGSGSVPSEQVLQRAQRLGHDLTRSHIMIVGALSTAGEPAEPRVYQRALSLVGDLVRPYTPRPLSAMHRGNIVTMWPIADDQPGRATSSADTAAALVQRAMRSVGKTVDATVAVSEPVANASSFAEPYRTAKGALAIALQAGRTNTVVRLQDLGVIGLLLQLEDSSQLAAFARRTLGPLIDYDESHRTDLVATLRTYFACRNDRNTTAGALHIHPNTVTQRLRRVEQLCGVELAEPSTTLQFSAALTVYDVASTR